MEKKEIIGNSLCKRKLQQEQQKITKTNKNQVKPEQNKSKLASKATSKIFFLKKRKKCRQRKIDLFEKRFGKEVK